MAKITIDPRRCEGHRTCVQVCPEGVLALRVVGADQPLLVKWRVALHGGHQAAVVDEAACTGCGLCLAACPERAITLTEPDSVTLPPGG
jgi:NAD-dependent dihydropyrimidine dehydrogenase PreA subunit